MPPTAPTVIQTKIDRMEQQLMSVEASNEDIKNNLEKVLVALIGDEFQSSEGLIKEMKSLRLRVEKLEAWKNKAIWMATGAGISGGIGIVELLKLVKKFIAS